MIGFLFFLALQPISRKRECRVNLRYVQVVYNALHYIYALPFEWASHKKQCSKCHDSLPFSTIIFENKVREEDL